MPAALPMALRARFQDYITEGLSGRAAASRLKVSAATGVRWLRKIRERGEIAPEAQGHCQTNLTGKRLILNSG